ncbi:MAG TPA: hypothetical protein VIM73_16755 [Polyangiaceae bacterium]
MTCSCEVCRSFRPELATDPSRELHVVELGKYSVWLCKTHFFLWKCSGVTTFEGLRKAFHEPSGKRSLVARRARNEGPRSERRTLVRPGRRSSDLPS